jgi:hypothetical protein
MHRSAPFRRQNLVSQKIHAFEGSVAIDHRDINPARKVKKLSRATGRASN